MRILVLAGITSFSLVMPITLVIAAILAIVATSYRQTIKAYPEGASSYIVASDNLGAVSGLVAASALLIDYVLTVAVSVSAGVAAITSIAPSLFPDRVLIAIGIVALLMLGNLRGIRESGTHLHGAHVPVHRHHRGPHRMGTLPRLRPGRPGDVRGPGGLAQGGGGDVGPHALPRPSRVQLRRGGPHRCRSYLRRRAGLQVAGVAERANHAHLGRDHLRQPLRGDQLPGQLYPRRAGSIGAQHGPLAHHPPGDGRRSVPRRAPGGDDPDPGPGREHELRGLPAPRLVPRPRRVHAAPVRLPRGAPRVHHRHRCPLGPGDPAAHRVPGQRHRAHSALHARGLRGLHPVPERDGGPMVAAPRPRLAPWPADQRPGRRHDRRDRPDRGFHEVPLGSLARHRDGPDPDHDHARHPPPLPRDRRCPRARSNPGWPRGGDRADRDRAHRPPRPPGTPGNRLRKLHLGPSDRRARHERSRDRRRPPRALASVGGGDRARRGRVAVPGAHRSPARLHGRTLRSRTPPDRSWWSSPNSSLAIGGRTSCTTRPPCG